jgi:hypothetical protein
MTNNFPAAVIYCDETKSNFGYRLAGRFLPKGTFPIGVVNSGGFITKTMPVEIPEAILETAVRELQRPEPTNLDNTLFLPGDILAIDVSGSREGNWGEFIKRVERTGATVVVFADRVVPASQLTELNASSTRFEPLEEYVNSLSEEPLRVFVLTDGWAPHIHPKNSHKWVWLIVPEGDDWPAFSKKNAMTVIHVNDPIA